jgi:hypothetical protein
MRPTSTSAVMSSMRSTAARPALPQDLSGTGFDLTETFAYNPAGQVSSKTVSNDAAYTAIPSPGTTRAQFDGQNQLRTAPDARLRSRMAAPR